MLVFFVTQQQLSNLINSRPLLGGPSPHVPGHQLSPLLTCLIFLMAHWVSGCVNTQSMTCCIEIMFHSLTDIDSHLPLLMVALADIAYQWEHLGTQLGLKYGKLKEIERNRRGIQIDCMREMLAEWLQGSGGECSKQTLKTALQKIGCSF